LLRNTQLVGTGPYHDNRYKNEEEEEETQKKAEENIQ
jgi:hypothetical protein